MSSDRYSVHFRIYFEVSESERNRTEGVVARERHGDERDWGETGSEAKTLAENFVLKEAFALDCYILMYESSSGSNNERCRV